MSMATILLIEDEEDLRQGLADNLSLDGYEVLCAENGSRGIEQFERHGADLVLLDIMMPELDGLETCRQLKEIAASLPVIMLTAKCSELDKVVGLELGADDYLTKPFGIRELLARIKALLRRSKLSQGLESQEELSQLSIGCVTVNFKTYRAKRRGEELSLSAKEFELLKCLARRADVPLTRDQLLDSVWGYNSYPTTRTVDNFISRLRQKIEEYPDAPRHIITVHGIGYKLVF